MQAGREYCLPDTAYVHESFIATKEQVMVEGKQVFFRDFSRSRLLPSQVPVFSIIAAAPLHQTIDFRSKNLYSEYNTGFKLRATFLNLFLEFYFRGIPIRSPSQITSKGKREEK